jgi:hypothetical protein
VVVYVVKALVEVPSENGHLLLELFFTSALFLIVAGPARPGGDVMTKIGILFLAAPLLVHFYRDAAVRWLFGPEALWEGVADRVDATASGRWSSPRSCRPTAWRRVPFSEAAGRLAPLAIGAFVGLVGALVMRQSYEVGYLLAKRGSASIWAPAPDQPDRLYLIALGSITWTFVPA